MPKSRKPSDFREPRKPLVSDELEDAKHPSSLEERQRASSSKKESIFEQPKKASGDDDIAEEPEGFKEHEEHDETPDELEHKMHIGGKEIDVYTEEGREELLEEDEVNTWEEGFSRGEDEPELAHCAQCGKVLSQDESKLIEREINHTTYLFCSAICAGKGAKHAKKR